MWEEKDGCRICSGGFVEVLDLGPIYPSEFVDELNEKIKVPLTLVICCNCKLVQLKHTVDRDKLYRQYWYQSGLNNSMVAALKDVAENVEKRINLVPGDVIVDIGCNDGTLFGLYEQKGLIKVGFDPAENLASLAETKCDYFSNNYFSADRFSTLRPDRSKVITSIAMFYDLDNPRSFIEDVKSILHEDGIWVIQMTDLISMLRTNAFDNICHEHLEYYSLHVLYRLLYEHELEVFEVSYNQVNGGSLRAYVGHVGRHKVCRSVDLALETERGYLQLYDDPFTAFRHRIHSIRDDVVMFITNEVERGQRFAVMGASTKGNTLLQYFGIDDTLIGHAAEINKEKFGKKTIGTNIPIVSERLSLHLKPDYYLILPWHFIDNFIDKHEDYLYGGGAFVVPMPEPALYFVEPKVMKVPL